LSTAMVSKRQRRSFLYQGVLNTMALVAIPSEAVWAKIDVSDLRIEGQASSSSTTGKPLSATVIPPPSLSSSSNRKKNNNNNSNNKVQTIELAGISYTPAAMILQMAEQTASMEGMMRANINDIQSGKSTKERIELGNKGQGPGVIRRQDLTRSIQIMITNSKLSLIAPKAVPILEGIPIFLNQNNGSAEMSSMEYQIIASKYEATREELRKTFEQMPPDVQQEGKQIVRAIRGKDMERMIKDER